MDKKFLLTLALACFGYAVNLGSVQAESSPACNCPDYEAIMERIYDNFKACVNIPGNNPPGCYIGAGACSLAAACDSGLLDDTCKTYKTGTNTFKDLCSDFGGVIIP